MFKRTLLSLASAGALFAGAALLIADSAEPQNFCHLANLDENFGFELTCPAASQGEDIFYSGTMGLTADARGKNIHTVQTLIESSEANVTFSSDYTNWQNSFCKDAKEADEKPPRAVTSVALTFTLADGRLFDCGEFDLSSPYGELHCTDYFRKANEEDPGDPCVLAVMSPGEQRDFSEPSQAGDQ